MPTNGKYILYIYIFSVLLPALSVYTFTHIVCLPLDVAYSLEANDKEQKRHVLMQITSGLNIRGLKIFSAHNASDGNAQQQSETFC